MSGHPLVGMVLLYPIFHNSARGSVILLTQFFKKSTEILKSQPFPAQNRFLRGRLTPEFAQKVRECSCRFSARHARRWQLRRPAGRTFCRRCGGGPDCAPAAPRTGAERRAGRALRRRAGAGGLPCGVAVLLPGIRPAARCRAPGASAGHRTDVPARSFAQ